MVKQVEQQPEQSLPPKQTKGVRFDAPAEVEENNKRSWPVNAVVYIGHLPHGFLEEQLQSYFSQYGQVLAIKVGRSRTTARSKGYAFLQFKYPEVANIVSDAMNGYLLLGKVLVSHTLNPSQKNPFWFSTSSQYKFINWKRLHLHRQQEPKTEEQTAHLVHGLLKNEEKRRLKFKELGITYQFPGFSSYIPAEAKPVAKQAEKKKEKSKKKAQ